MSLNDTTSSYAATPLISIASPPRHLYALDGLRGVCAVTVMIGHILAVWTPKYSDKTKKAPLFGLDFLQAVTIFFVISGFTLVYVSNDNSHADGPGRFVWKRFARLAPVYYVGLIIGLLPLVLYYNAEQVIISVIVSLLCVQSLTIIGGEWNGVLWTVSAFAMCYLIFIPITNVLRRWTSVSLVLLIVTLCIISGLIVPTVILFLFPNLIGILHISFLFRLPQFVVGVISGLLHERHVLPFPTVYAELSSIILACSFIGCALVTYYSGATAWGYYIIASEFLLLPVHALWISALSSPSCNGPTAIVFSSPPLQALGTISYALYCTHYPVLNWCAWAVYGGVSAETVPLVTVDNRTGWFAFPDSWNIIPLAAVCITVAAIVYYSIEFPMRKLLNSRESINGTSDPQHITP